MILDGWGISENEQNNAVKIAATPNLDALMASNPCARLTCSGESVGLPPGIMGNSEVGHLNIGAGRIVYQDLLRIDKAIADGSFYENRAINAAIDQALQHKTALHLMGLVSDGGVHSQLTHLLALIDLVNQRGVGHLYIHVILDGRDTPPDGGVAYVQDLQEHLDKHGGAIATIVGRYYAMDRDKRWNRTEKAYQLFTQGKGLAEEDPVNAVHRAYERGETDEFVKPVVMTTADGRPRAMVRDGDAVIFFNFRADRARQITRAFTDPEFDDFTRKNIPKLGNYTSMTRYDEQFTLPVAYPPAHIPMIFGEVISKHGLKQLRIAETEKYAHVTYFFNGGEEKAFPNEDRVLIPSPRDVPTYDHKPEMSALEVTEEVIKRIHSGTYDVIILNFANMDMVGHTGILAAAVKACETVDHCVGRITEAIRKKTGALLITADHGNSETMADAGGAPFTAHTTNPVPLVLVDEARQTVTLKDGILGDIAPTMLDILGIEQPPEMTGKSLLGEQK